MSDAPELELDSEHIYRLNGAIIPGTTDVLKAVGAAPSLWFLDPDHLEFLRERGQAVHKAIELMIRGTLDKRTVAPIVKPYLIGFERFCNDYNVEVITRPGGTGPEMPFTEIPLHSDVYRYGSTPDVVAKVKGRIAPIEIKATSAHSAATEIQTAAQSIAIEQALGMEKKFHNEDVRWAVRLMPEEPYYDPKKYTERGDRSTWIGMLSTYNWKVRKKLIKP